MLPTIEDLFNLSHTEHSDLFSDINQPWEVILRIGPYADDHVQGINKGDIHSSAVIGDKVDIGRGTTIGPNVVIDGPTIIGKNCRIRSGVLIRGNVIIGDDVIVGNSTEIKNALLFNKVAIPHFNYVGDSILGYKVHFGGGAGTSNYKGDGSEIYIKCDGDSYPTGMNKLGAIVGDEADLGSLVILNPGTIIGAKTNIYPGAIIRGVIPPNSIVKLRQDQEIVEKN